MKNTPWHNDGLMIYDSEGEAIAQVALAPRDSLKWAALIAAAPELLEALKETRDAGAALLRAIYQSGMVQQVLCSLPDTWNGFGKRADAAIAKAEGVAPETAPASSPKTLAEAK